MAQTIVNAAPSTVMLGVQDISTESPVVEPEVLPTHLPKVYTYAETGPLEPQLVVGGALTQMYGANSFDLRRKYATHQTAFINTVNAQANSMMVERVVPTDAPPPANARLFADVLSTKIDEYARNVDGTIQKDNVGNPVPTGEQIDGFKVKWVVAHVDLDEDGNDMFGKGEIGPGDQTDSTTGEQSKRYPILDIAYPHVGERGNRNGMRLYAPTEQSSTPVNVNSLVKDKVYPFRLSLVEKSVSTGTPITQPTQSGALYVDFCLKPGVISSVDESEFYITKRFPARYQLLNDPSGLPSSWGPIGKSAVYSGNVDLLIKQFYAAELPYVVQGQSDFDGSEDEEYRFNLLSGVSSANVPYHSYQIVSAAANAQRLTENSVFYVSGGGDGTMDESKFAELVSERVRQYADPLSYLQNTAKFPEAYIYDTGFPLQTKYDLLSFIALRKDTAVFLVTHDVLGPELTADEESSLAIALRTRAQQYPESDYFGTATMRCAIFGRSGLMLNSQYTKPLPLVLDFAKKAAVFMGAGNGKWKADKGFDQEGLNQVDLFGAVNVSFTPGTVRNKDWDNGLVWVEDYSRRSLYWPAFHTVYDDDTSVLTSIITMMACVELEKIGLRAQRRFSGNSKLTNAQFKTRIEKFVNDEVQDKFDSRFIITPTVTFSDADLKRGYSWTLTIKIQAPNMKTVQTLVIQAARMDTTTASS